MNCVHTNNKEKKIWLGSFDFDLNFEKKLVLEKEFNMSMEQVADLCDVLCGL